MQNILGILVSDRPAVRVEEAIRPVATAVNSESLGRDVGRALSRCSSSQTDGRLLVGLGTIGKLERVLSRGGKTHGLYLDGEVDVVRGEGVTAGHNVALNERPEYSR
jgi:hypothetical protein